MTVAAILEIKGREVLTAVPDMKMAEAVDLLATHKVGAIVVAGDDGKVQGIVSERDIVRELAGTGPSILDMPLSKCMTRKVISCGESDTIEQVMGVMTANRFRHMPVVTNGRLAGIISIGDVVKRKIEQAERDAQDLRNYIATA